MWNESFTFEINLGTEPLRIEVLDKDTFGEDDSEGISEVMLVDHGIPDQLKHDIWVELVDKKTLKKTGGRLRLMIQFVHSKVKYFEDYLARWDNTLREDAELKVQVEGFIRQLETPFGFLNTLMDEAPVNNENPNVAELDPVMAGV